MNNSHFDPARLKEQTMNQLRRISLTSFVLTMLVANMGSVSAQDAKEDPAERVTPFDLPNPFSESDIVPAPKPKEPADPAEIQLSTPRKLSMPVDDLLQKLGQNPHGTLNGVPYPFTPETCSTLSLKAAGCGLYADAIALAEFGLTQEKLVASFSHRETLLFSKAVSEFATGKRKNCTATMRLLAVEMNLTVDADDAEILSELQELSLKLPGPLAIRFRYAFKGLVRTSPGEEVAATQVSFHFIPQHQGS